MKLRWSHAVVYVRDLETMLDFYTGVLGFEVSDRGHLSPDNPDLQLAFLSQVDTDHHQLALVNVRRDEERPNSVDHFAFRVDDLTSVKAFAKRLQEDGRASELHPITHGNAWSIYFRDPEGNGLEIFCDTPFHVAQPQARPFDIEMDEAELREWTAKEFGEEPGFGPIDAYYAERARKLADS
jgi:catechol 2,3-dioxygenase-like lactoylglutathione lyase family enzyme